MKSRNEILFHFCLSRFWAVVMDPSTPRGDGGAEGHPTGLKGGKQWEEKRRGRRGRGKGYRRT
jgi:hypothetical protein